MNANPGKHSNEIASALLEIVQTAGSTLNLAEVLDRVVEKAAQLTGADRASIWLLDSSQERLLPAALYGMDPDFTYHWKRYVLSVQNEPLSQEAIDNGRPAIVLDAESDPRTDKTAVSMFGDKSMLVVPLASKGRIIGTLFLNHVTQHHIYTPQDLAITQAIASQTAVAIENAQLYEQSRRMSEELMVSFQRIGEALAAGLDLSETLQVIVNLATEMVHAQAGVVELLTDDHGLEVQATYGLPFEETWNRVSQEGDRLGEMVISSGHLVRIADMRSKVEEYASNPLGLHLASFIGVPLRLRGAMLGIIAVYDSTPERFSSAEAELLASFANQGSLAIENARLFMALQEQVAELSRAMGQNAALFSSLQQEKERLDAIIRNSSDAIYMLDQDLRVVEFNPAAEQLTGYSAADAIGNRCPDILRCARDPQDAKGPDGYLRCEHGGSCPMLEVFRDHTPAPYVEMRIETRDKQLKDVAVSFSIIPASSDGGPFGVAIARDISRIKELDRLKSDFVSMVSHELRTPLAVIKGYAATLLNPMVSVDEDRQHRFIKGINDASDRLTRLIDNVLSVSRMESGRFRSNPQLFDLNDLIAKVASTLRSASSRHDLVTILPPTTSLIRADRDQIEQVLTNLISNAVKYSPDGGMIAVTLEPRGAEARISVTDEGVGIPKTQLGRMFEKFYRGDMSVTRRVTGVGLGLYICRSIVEAHGGRIWVESELGHGSTFIVELPNLIPSRPNNEAEVPSSQLGWHPTAATPHMSQTQEGG